MTATGPRPLLPVELDTIRVALALLRAADPASPQLEAARQELGMPAIIGDEAIATLSAELAEANVVSLWHRLGPRT